MFLNLLVSLLLVFSPFSRYFRHYLTTFFIFLKYLTLLFINLSYLLCIFLCCFLVKFYLAIDFIYRLRLLGFLIISWWSCCGLLFFILYILTFKYIMTNLSVDSVLNIIPIFTMTKQNYSITPFPLWLIICILTPIFDRNFYFNISAFL